MLKGKGGIVAIPWRAVLKFSLNQANLINNPQFPLQLKDRR